MSSRRRSAATTRDGSDHTSPVCQATSRPDSELAGFRQAEEGHVSPTADGRRRESSPTASRYLLRNTRARAYRRVTTAGPGARPATSPARAMATKTGPRRDASRRNGDGGRQRSSAHTHTHTRTHTLRHTYTHTHIHTHTHTLRHTHTHIHTYTHTHTRTYTHAHTQTHTHTHTYTHTSHLDSLSTGLR